MRVLVCVALLALCAVPSTSAVGLVATSPPASIAGDHPPQPLLMPNSLFNMALYASPGWQPSWQPFAPMMAAPYLWRSDINILPFTAETPVPFPRANFLMF